MQSDQVAVPVHEESQAGEARRAAQLLSKRIGLDSEDAARVGIVITEAARNLAKHAKEGQIIVRGVQDDWLGIEVLAIDRGPGIASVAEAFRDGYSTSGTPGTGLGAIRRIADDFDIYTQPERGTVLLARVRSRNSKPNRAVVLSVICVPLHGETACGDNWAVRRNGRTWMIMVADGLGHGVIAAEAADEAVHIFRSSQASDVAEILQDMHGALRTTRGAAVGIARVNFDASEVRYTAVGNISGAVMSGSTSKQMVYSNGTVGAQMRKMPHDFSYPFPRGATLIMHSDGVATWHLDRYPGLLAKDPGVIAGVLFRDFRRVRDDATVLVAREVKA